MAAALALGVAPARRRRVLVSDERRSPSRARPCARCRSSPRVAPDRVGPLLAGGVVALVAGVAAIWFFVRLLQTRGFYRFAYYTWAAGALFLGWLTFR